jgi:hypothetical protein
MLLARCKESPQAAGLIDSTSIKANLQLSTAREFLFNLHHPQSPLFLFPLLDDSIAVSIDFLNGDFPG